MIKRPEIVHTAFTVGSLVVGLFVFLLDRQPESIYFIPDWVSFTNNISPIFGYIGNHLPTFVRVYAFILLTTVVIAPSPVLVFTICAAWFAIDSLFELAQMAFITHWIAESVLPMRDIKELPLVHERISFTVGGLTYLLNRFLLATDF